MDRHSCFIGFSLLLVSSTLQAQNDSAHFLNEVTVVENRFKASSIGQYQYKSDSISRLNNTVLTVGNWLESESSIHVRQYAPGSVGFFSTRGATSGQSAVMWSGFNLNSSATGLTDLSVLPLELFNPEITQGGNSASFGSGAIGGVLQLSADKKKSQGWHGQFSQQVASFKTFASSLGVSFQNQKFLSHTKLHHSQSQNNFSYTNYYRFPDREEKREHAEYSQSHVQQTFAFALNKKNRVEAEAWMNWAERNSPKPILSISPGVAVLKDKYLRARAGWFHDNKNTKWDVQYAYLYEWQTYEDSLVPEGPDEHLLDTNISIRHAIQLNHQYAFGKYLVWQNGLKSNLDEVKGSNRKGQQNIVSLQSGLYFSKDRLSSQVVIRGEFWNGELLPLSPFASIKANLFSDFFASANGGYVYRIPTMNDRFWVPGGNENLEPENGWTGEGSVFYDKKGKYHLLIRLSEYVSQLENYIQWIPANAGIWSPQNVKQVFIYGTDLNAEFSTTLSKWYIQWKLGASYNSSTVKETNLPNDNSIGKQLIYQPKYKSNLGITLGYANWYLGVNGRYVGSVLTSYDGFSNDLADYALFSMSLSHPFSIKKLLCNVIVAANNITQTEYQTIAYFPMPLTNYSITLKLNI